ncbi:MAG: hypothetical protein FJ104_04245 [Deltaproteobacteria bacterium]|nr:hypothetical protein [Deltaproteobacteria bacterium]
MPPAVLGRITSPADRPRGPDVTLSVQVPESWIAEGATLAVTLPRNLSCAACGGGGCDTCGRAGAVSLRGRGEPPEIVEVRLPSPSEAAEDAPASSAGVRLRVPDRGGLPPVGSDLPRGNLLLSVGIGSEPSAGTERVVPVLLPSDMPAPAPVEPTAGRAEARSGPAPLLVGAALLLVALLTAWLLSR